MTGHFQLDVHPDSVLAAADRLGELAETAGAHGRRVRGAPDRWRPGWRSDSSTVIGEQAVALGTHLGDFDDRIAAASRAVRSFGRALEEARGTELPDLNRRWQEAQGVYDDAVRTATNRRDRAVEDLDPGQGRRGQREELDQGMTSAIGAAHGALTVAQDRLTAEFEELRSRLRRRARALGGSLSQEVAVPVPAVAVAAYRSSRDHGWAAALWGLLGDPVEGLSGRARELLGGPLGDLRSRLADPPTDGAELRELLARARELGVPPDQYASTLEAFWQLRAAEAAGIDLEEWDPSRGAAHNKAIIEAVYRYYGDLYLSDPDLQWAGMANMIGPSFAAGFFDLHEFRRIAEALTDVPDPARAALPEGVEDLADLPEDELRYYEEAFLQMQQEIFFDQASMHQAYVDGGLEAVREMGAAGLIPQDVVDAWSDLDSGDPARVAAANELFLHREQFEIIDDDYQRMHEHDPSGPAMTWMMTFIGEPSIPGAQGYPDVFPLTVRAETPGPERVGTPRSIFGQEIPHVSVDNPAQGSVEVETPFPDGNIAHFDDRWALIADDTLPAFQELLREDPDRARDLIGADVGDRIDGYRLHRRIDDILRQLGDWSVDVDQ